MRFNPNLNGREDLTGLFWLLMAFLSFLPFLRPWWETGSAPVQSAASVIRKIETAHFQVEAERVPEADLFMVCIAAERARQELTAAGFPCRAEEKIPLTVFPDTESLARHFGWEKNEQAMGAYHAGELGVLAPSVWMEPEKSLPRFEREGPLLHELTHLVVDEMMEGHYNRWWTEGIAQYMEKKLHGFQMKTPAEIDRVYTLEELTRRFETLEQRQAYYQALLAVEYLTEKYSESVLTAIMQEAAARKDFDKSLSAVLGIGYNEFVQHIENSIRLDRENGV